ncbi:MAG: MFS transporter [Pirellulaceae bacterium]|nr:MFS transporter [Pirellulaceae bacterium]
MSTNNSSATPSATVSLSSATVTLICVIASIGFAFDIYELLMLPLILKPALAALGGLTEAGTPRLAPGSPEYVAWARTLFFLPALVGGVFGLVGGYLTDLLGRRRVLTWSILLYAFSAMAAGFSTSIEMLLVCRCLVFIGVCVEFVAAVAWLAELFDEPKQRERVLGFTQAFSSIGGLLVGFAALIIANLTQAETPWLPAIYGKYEAWRYTLISGVIPALPLIIIRPFLPESPKWQMKKKSGQLRRPSILELFAPGLAKTTIVTTLMFAASYGIAFGAIQQLPQILGGHAQVVADSKAVVAKAVETTKKEIPEGRKKGIEANAKDEAIAGVTIWQEFGGLFGRFALALLAGIIVSRRQLMWVFQIPALIFVPLLFWWISGQLKNEDSLAFIKYGIFIAGFFTVAQFSFWGNYIPRVFPLHLRGTGESFAANIGGRVIGTAAAWLTLTFSASAPGTPPDAGKIAVVGAIVAGAYCLVGFLLSPFMTEPDSESLE